MASKNQGERGGAKAALSTGLVGLCQRMKDVDLGLGDKIDHLRKRISPPPNHTFHLTPSERADLHEKHQAQGLPDSGQKSTRNATVRSRSSVGGAKPTGPARRAGCANFGTVRVSRSVSSPTLRKTNGRGVSVVDTTSCVDLKKHDPQSFRGCLRRKNAVRRQNGRKEGSATAYETGRIGERMFFENARDEARWRRNLVGIELLPPSQSQALGAVQENSEALPAAPSRVHSLAGSVTMDHSVPAGGSGHRPGRALPTLGKKEDVLSLPPSGPGSSRRNDADCDAARDPDVPLWLLYRSRADRRSAADQVAQTERLPAPDHSHTGASINYRRRPARIVEGPGQVAEIHRTPSIRSQSAELVTSNSEIPNLDPIDPRISEPFNIAPETAERIVGTVSSVWQRPEANTPAQSRTAWITRDVEGPSRRAGTQVSRDQLQRWLSVSTISDVPENQFKASDIEHHQA